MKGEEYIDALRANIKKFEHWKENGNTIISDCGASDFLKVIEADMNELSRLNANEVKDEILEHENGISWRIKRIEKYGLLPLLQYLEDFKNIKVILDDEAVSKAIDTYFLRIYEKANDLCRVMAVAEKYIPQKPKKKVKSCFADIVQYHDKEQLIKRLHELIDGKGGADVGSVLFKASEDRLLTRVPTQAEFKSEFTLIGGWSAIHNYMVFDPNDNNKLTRAFNIKIFD